MADQIAPVGEPVTQVKAIGQAVDLIGEVEARLHLLFDRFSDDPNLSAESCRGILQVLMDCSSALDNAKGYISS